MRVNNRVNHRRRSTIVTHGRPPRINIAGSEPSTASGCNVANICRSDSCASRLGQDEDADLTRFVFAFAMWLQTMESYLPHIYDQERERNEREDRKAHR